MDNSINTRNVEIKNAFIAGNTNKTELAAYFGVSVSTIRRVLAGVVMSIAVAGSTVAVTAIQYSLKIETKADATQLAADVSTQVADSASKTSSTAA